MKGEKRFDLKLTENQANVLLIAVRGAVGKGLLEVDDEDVVMDIRDRLLRWFRKQEEGLVGASGSGG